MLVLHFIFIEELRHFLSQHIPVIRNRDDRDRFLGLGVRLRLRVGRRLALVRVTHTHSIHQYRRRYSNDSNDDFSVKGCPHALHVTK